MRTLFLILFFASFYTVKAQLCAGPGRTADGAEAVCGTLVFTQQFLPSCTGQGNIPNPSAGCGDIVTTDNSAWYKFHCYQTGTLGFLLTPGNLADDYDWEIMDVTGHAPTDVFTNELRVSLNLSGQTGVTGCTLSGLLAINCGGGNPGSQFNAMPVLLTGHDYLLMVNNWSHSGTGYSLTFSGTAKLTDQLPPTITNVSTTCDASKIQVAFSKDILCSSITPLGTEFTITGGTNVITGIVSQCSSGANSVMQLTITLQSPLPSGNYNLQVNTGTDGNSFWDVCKDELVPTSIPFFVPPITAVKVDTITFTSCAPTALDVKLTKPVWCNSITGSGSEFTIMPGNIAVASVQTNCSGSTMYTDMLHLNLPNALPYGNYQLVVYNGTDGNTLIDTCNISMVNGTTVPFVINQTTTAPLIQSIGFDECHPDKVVVNFDKPVLCTTVSPTANEFTVTGGAPPITAVNYTCVNGYITQAVLTLQNNLPAGNFAVGINNGSDGNSLADTCYSFMPAGYSKSFVATKAPAPKFDSVQVDKCNTNFVKLFYSHAIKCSSISTDGSDFTVTGPAAVTVSGATTNAATCALGYTNWVMLQLTQPITVFGNYTVHNKIGTDANGVIDTCSALQNIAETISFSPSVQPSAAFISSVKFSCKMDTITLSHPGGNGINSWAWVFDDGTTDMGQTVIHAFPVSTPTATIQLTVSNGNCSSTSSQTITLDNAFNAAFTQNPKDTGCINTTVTFKDASIGKNIQYLWQFGDNTQFVGQNPPPHIYTTSNSYNVKLILSDLYGCVDTASSVINITPSAAIDFTGIFPVNCTDKVITLTRNVSSNIYDVAWDNGDGITFGNKTIVQFSYAKQGSYVIKLSGIDKYCGTVQTSKVVDIFTVPKIKLGNDTVLCPAVQLSIGVPFTPGYTYQWSNGATSSQILTDIYTSNYSLLVDNNGCKGQDDISVKVLPACLIMVPNVFTPNGDGNNDKLKAINADLAKAFTLKVYNRNGQLMYTTNNPLEGWDGFYKNTKADAGTYVWQLTYIDPWSNKQVFTKGTTILVR